MPGPKRCIFAKLPHFDRLADSFGDWVFGCNYELERTRLVLVPVPLPEPIPVKDMDNRPEVGCSQNNMDIRCTLDTDSRSNRIRCMDTDLQILDGLGVLQPFPISSPYAYVSECRWASGLGRVPPLR